ncbi:DUF4288 domain-containing protein [Halalkalibacterium halodurans]|uniref:BH3086 protein n=1 Tax=Halalkalibacterium halodurans (strain ATCC BAA-125 / DSM 18197 / FERM 7344 / JCM 9153 / C-125) TaxID=272558 RepID=Q9K8C0_HALH5|nr:DUF4288 domain-containing protein [Halalkalibacterium halodurans]MED4082069.1 DUF4288 domain-containing protein [Halalkalibacterium halodurans]MED4084353.1 DUF4288 domain-containing protein [Halalkalibacterium halodurans]MED4103662.1 DUF4288 domain-containing protein [Halalkalibacterium halodurans]MED4107629.1 DUF4288 domain-containing protein [Halalkalibacterium halodurans]MED4126248.1 DUF4288 domain-containing protein [Halalkalibacterium halodurans]
MGGKWFVVNLLYKSIKTGILNRAIEANKKDPMEAEVFEERHVLVRAESRGQAHRIGEQLGRKAEQQYQNPYGEQVRWTFVALLDSYEVMDDLEHGAEIYSRYIVSSKGTTTEEVKERYFPEE